MTEQQTPHSEEITQADLRATEEVVADAVLRSDKSWDVLREFYGQLGGRILHTAQFTIPVLQNLNDIEQRLNDPVAFRKSFDTLMTDLQDIRGRLGELKVRHEGQTGEPTPEQWPMIFETSMEYQNLFHRMDTTINPLIQTLANVLKEEYSETLTLQVVE